MRSIHILLLTLVIISTPFTQDGWESIIGTTDNEFPVSFIQNEDGSFLICGIVNDVDNIQNKSLFVTKADEMGEELWTKRFDTLNVGSVNQIISAPNGGALLIGATQYSDTAIDAFWLKIDSSGSTEWFKIYNDTLQSSAASAVEKVDGGFAVLLNRTIQFEGYTQNRICIMEVDSVGEVTNDTVYAIDSTITGVKILSTEEEGYIVCGYYRQTSNNGGDDFIALGIDSTGKQVFVNTYGKKAEDKCHDATITSNGDILMTGFVYGDSQYDDHDLALVRARNDGYRMFFRTYGESKSDPNKYTHIDIGKAIIETGNGEIVTVGESDSYGEGDRDVWMMVYDQSGNELVNKTFGGTNTNYALDVLESRDGAIVILGLTFSKDGGGIEIYLIKTFIQITHTIKNPILKDDKHDVKLVKSGNDIFLKGKEINSVKLIDFHGRTVMDICEENGIFKFSTSTLAKGNYFLRYGVAGRFRTRSVNIK